MQDLRTRGTPAGKDGCLREGPTHRVVLTGQTYPARDQLRRLGWSWAPSRQGWLLRVSVRQTPREVLAELQRAGIDTADMDVRVG